MSLSALWKATQHVMTIIKAINTQAAIATARKLPLLAEWKYSNWNSLKYRKNGTSRNRFQA